MGYIKNDAIIVSGAEEDCKRARKKAKALGLPVTSCVEETINGGFSFLIAPDGSKEGWDESARADAARQQWKEWMKDKEFAAEWVHVRFGGDEPRKTRIEDFA